jgi:hypothetical protein
VFESSRVPGEPITALDFGERAELVTDEWWKSARLADDDRTPQAAPASSAAASEAFDDLIPASRTTGRKVFDTSGLIEIDPVGTPAPVSRRVVRPLTEEDGFVPLAARAAEPYVETDAQRIARSHKSRSAEEFLDADEPASDWALPSLDVVFLIIGAPLLVLGLGVTTAWLVGRFCAAFAGDGKVKIRLHRTGTDRARGRLNGIPKQARILEHCHNDVLTF